MAFVLALLAVANSAILPANPITTTYVGPTAPVATSYQVVSRNVNSLLVPSAPAITTRAIGYPGYVHRWRGYPYNYHYGYAGYGYPYGYGYNLYTPYGHLPQAW